MSVCTQRCGQGFCKTVVCPIIGALSNHSWKKKFCPCGSILKKCSCDDERKSLCDTSSSDSIRLVGFQRVIVLAQIYWPCPIPWLPLHINGFSRKSPLSKTHLVMCHSTCCSIHTEPVDTVRLVVSFLPSQCQVNILLLGIDRILWV